MIPRPLAAIETSLRALPSGTGLARVTLERSQYETLYRDAMAMFVVCEAQYKKDRSTICQMASTIASGLLADANGPAYVDLTYSDHARDSVASIAVDLAQRIMARVDAQVG